MSPRARFRKLRVAALSSLALVWLVLGSPRQGRAQFVVFDPTNYGNAVLRYLELQQQFTELVETYEQIRTQATIGWDSSWLL